MYLITSLVYRLIEVLGNSLFALHLKCLKRKSNLLTYINLKYLVNQYSLWVNQQKGDCTIFLSL